MRAKIAELLSRLSLREIILLFGLVMLCGGYFGLNFSQKVLTEFFDYDFSEINQQIKIANEAKTLQNSLLRQEKQLENLQNLATHFEADENTYISTLNSIATNSNIAFSGFKHENSQSKDFNRHFVSLEFESSFQKFMRFLSNLQHSRLYFDIRDLKIERLSDTNTLKSTMRLYFIPISNAK